MRYTCNLVIDRPRDAVLALFDDADNLKRWQPSLVSYEHLSGTPGQNGAKAKLIYKEGEREIEMIETITDRALPDRFAGTYTTKGVSNTIVNRFHEVGPERTVWEMESDFRFSGWMRFVMPLMKRAFERRTLADMGRFKAFAEKPSTKKRR